MIKNYIVLRFDSIQNGIDFMSSYEYPSSFIVDNTVYDKNGFEVNYENLIEFDILGIRNVVTNENLFMESVICYDGDNLFIYKPN